MTRLPQEIIRDKRDGKPLEPEDIKGFIEALSANRVTDAQIAAFAMAVFFKGMAAHETIALTEAMRDSGEVLDWSDLGKPVVDKHSTGGVGDNVSLILGPLVAACGAAVPMISGRGLGHTGGTLDKLESIPGYDTSPDISIFRRVVGEIGCAIVGPTANLAPADKRFYAVRDVTATVESIPLIVASILSKKLAAGPENLVLDVKTGSGAFMAGYDDAKALATSLVDVANGAGLATTALITRMDQPLASAAGNALEVKNAVDLMTGDQGDRVLRDVVLALAAEMLVLARLFADPAAARRKAEDALDTGAAAETFGRMVAALGGPSDFLDRIADHLPVAPVIRAVDAPRDGRIATVDARRIGIAVVEMGGGRSRSQDRIDPAVGFSALARIGQEIRRGEPLAMVHARDEAAADRAAAALREAYVLGEAMPPDNGEANRPFSAVLERIG